MAAILSFRKIWKGLSIVADIRQDRDRKIPEFPQVGVVNGLAVHGANTGILLEIEAFAIRGRSR